MAARQGRTRRIISGVLFAVVMLAGLSLVMSLVVVPRVFGYETYVIVGRSMTGTIDIGSLVYSKPTPVQQLKVGDIITFMPPGMDKPDTHRIIGEKLSPEGKRVFTTQGDNVPSPDPWNLQITSPKLPRYAFHIPWLGFGVAVLSIRLVRILLFVLPVMLVAGAALVRLWRQAGDELAAEDGVAVAGYRERL